MDRECIALDPPEAEIISPLVLLSPESGRVESALGSSTGCRILICK